MKIEITNIETRIQAGVSQRTGKNYSINKQVGYLHLSDQHYPIRFEFNLRDGVQPYSVGFYSVKESNFYIDRFGALCINNQLDLFPINNK